MTNKLYNRFKTHDLLALSSFWWAHTKTSLCG